MSFMFDDGTGVLLGTVSCVKEGKGRAKDTLSLVTLETEDGTVEVQCWNSSYKDGAQLSDAARSIKAGEPVSMLVKQQKNGYVARRMKKAGTYRGRKDNREKTVIYGKLSRIVEDDSGNAVVTVPVSAYRNGSFHVRWEKIRCNSQVSSRIFNEMMAGDRMMLLCEPGKSGAYFAEACIA